MKVVLAEKPSVARDIARVLGATEKKNGYIEGNGWAVTWAFGHLVALAEPDEYGWGAPWVRSSLPMIPSSFRLSLKEQGAKGDDKTLQQFSVIKRLFADAEYIVCATDAGREGELIFRNIYNFMECRTPFKRLWISSLTDSAIKGGFGALKEGSDYDNIFHSAECRAKADWIIGMNATRALTLANPNKGVFTLGRVQTPTFSFVCNRYYENKNFVPTAYFKLKAKLKSSDGVEFSAVCPDTFQTKTSAEEKLRSLGAEFTLTNREDKMVNEKAPLPFSLTDLQRTANKELGLSAQDTLNALQSLYEAKMTTYPRTDSSYLAEDMFAPVSEKVGTLARLSFLKKEQTDAIAVLSKNGIQRACFDNSKLTDHHAVIPTFEKYEEFDSLSAVEKNIYQLVVKRFIQSLMPVCVKEQLSYSFSASDGTLFKCSGSTIKELGWRGAYPADAKKKDDADDDGEEQNLPVIMEGEVLTAKSVSAEEKKTKRPPLLTEAELLKLMETAGKLIEDKELSKAIKDCGLGTPATRASMIEGLKSRSMIEVKDKKYLVPTERGLAVYDAIKSLDLSKPDVTGEWESKLNKIAEGGYDPATFISEISERCKSLVTELDAVKIDVSSSEGAAKLLPDGLHCPLCGGAVLEGAKTVRCEHYSIDNPSEGCPFVVFKSNKFHTFSAKELSELVASKETSDVVALKVADKVYNVRFKFDTSKNKVEFIYDNSICACPKCGKSILEYKSGFACEGNTKENASCDFLLWKNVSGHELSRAEFLTLLDKKILPALSFVSKEGKPYKADLRLKDDFSTEIVFAVEKVCDCPKCGSAVKEMPKGFICTCNTKDNPSCDFILWKEVNGYVLDKKDLAELLSKKVLKDRKFLSKEGKPYRANLTLLSDYKLKIDIPRKEVGVCPLCGETVYETDKVFCCSKYSRDGNGCSFSVWREVYGHTLSSAEITTILKNKVLKKVPFVSKQGKAYNADLILENGKITMKF